MMNLIYLGTLAALLTGVISEDFPARYTTAFPDGLGPPLDPGMLKVPITSYTYKKWAWGTVPHYCQTTATNNFNFGYCDVYDLEVYDVMYKDCAAPWTLCRCHNATMSATALMDNVGRIPVGARQYVRYFMSFAGGGSAYSLGAADLHFFGDFTKSPTVFIHETSHNLDVWVGGSGLSRYSTSQKWMSAVGKDTCVPDNYARTNYQEDYAQNGVLAAYQANVSPISSIENIDCMSNQFKNITSQLTNALKYNSGAKCAYRFAATDKVCMGPEASNQGACKGVPNTKREDAGALLMERGIKVLDTNTLPQKLQEEIEVHGREAEEENRVAHREYLQGLTKREKGGVKRDFRA